MCPWHAKELNFNEGGVHAGRNVYAWYSFHPSFHCLQLQFAIECFLLHCMGESLLEQAVF